MDESGFQTMDMNNALLQEEMLLSRISSEESGEELVAGGAVAVFMEDGGIADSAERQEDSVVENTNLQKMSDCYAEQEQIYTSFETFTEGTGILLALSGESLPGELKGEEYILTGNSFLLVRLETEESVLLLHQSYYGDISEHAAEAAYRDGVVNERIYTTSEGFAYKLVDSQDGQEIHAAIAVGNYELILDFFGYTEREACEVLESMDLSVYL